MSTSVAGGAFFVLCLMGRRYPTSRAYPAGPFHTLRRRPKKAKRRLQACRPRSRLPVIIVDGNGITEYICKCGFLKIHTLLVYTSASALADSR